MRLPFSFYLSRYSFLGLLILTIAASCTNSNQAKYTALQLQLKKIDSLRQMQGDSSTYRAMQQLRPKLNANPALLCPWYAKMSLYYSRDLARRTAYADSAMAFFNDKGNIDQYPDDYYQTVLSKGDACLHTGKYVTALDYFDRAKKSYPKLIFATTAILTPAWA